MPKTSASATWCWPPARRGERRLQLRRALAQHPREFSTIYCAVIGAGEASGSLGQVLERLADDLEERQARQIDPGAALYPAIVTLVSITIVLFLVATWCRRWRGCLRAPSARCRFLTVAMLA